MRFILIVITLMTYAGPSYGQALSPMNGNIKTYTDVFAIQLQALNPYDTAQTFSVTLSDGEGNPATDIELSSRVLQIPPNGARSFFVWGLVNKERRVMVCLTSAYFTNGVGAQIRGEVCGKYQVSRLAL
ncbi:hypothetical protein ABFZ85_09165 [Hyphococcus formosus]|uniref:hypothetical protein n=1 Tax=Hyphococcus formosus TaxID=3143534 RepID=UPI00398B4B0B